jgi:hypothetical protein
MFNPEKRLIVDIKVQNRLREWFSRIADPTRNCDRITCIQFGDSEVDYDLGFDYTKIRVLNAPYNIESIKSKLAFEGLTSGISGKISTYFRRVGGDSNLSSYYNYPANNNLSLGITVPTLANAWDKNEILLENDENYGWIGFIETLPDNYLDINGNQLRLKEKYEIILNNPGGQLNPIIIDDENGSFFFSVPEISVASGTTIGNITIKGITSGLTKIVNLKII